MQEQKPPSKMYLPASKQEEKRQSDALISADGLRVNESVSIGERIRIKTSSNSEASVSYKMNGNARPTVSVSLRIRLK